MKTQPNIARLAFTLRVTAFLWLALVVIFPMATQAQKLPALPAKLDAYNGQYPDRFMKLPAVKARLRALLGKYYVDFIERTAVQGEFERNGDYLSATSLMAHMGGSEDAILIIDLKTRTLHCGVFSDGIVGFNLAKGKKKKGLLKFSETPDKMPDILTNWTG